MWKVWNRLDPVGLPGGNLGGCRGGCRVPQSLQVCSEYPGDDLRDFATWCRHLGAPTRSETMVEMSFGKSQPLLWAIWSYINMINNQSNTISYIHLYHLIPTLDAFGNIYWNESRNLSDNSWFIPCWMSMTVSTLVALLVQVRMHLLERLDSELERSKTLLLEHSKGLMDPNSLLLTHG